MNNDSKEASSSGGGHGRIAAIDWLIKVCLNNKFIVTLLVLMGSGFGVVMAPFDWELGGLPRYPVPVDAIPDIGENQQIVFTKWMGRSPQDVEDQIGYPLTVSLLGVPGVKTIRSYSSFGFSSIYIIFEENIEFYWSRSRVLEKLNSLPAGTLPDGVQPALGPDAISLGQIFWYTLEGLDENGEPTGGWDLDELRSTQDWNVRYSLLSARGISEVGSIGGFVREYQIDVDPDAMRAHRVKLEEVLAAVKNSNIDVGARSIEVNKVEYFIRGLGFIKNVRDVELSVVKVNENIPIYVKDVAKVSRGPALRRGALDKEGAEAVGGVVVVRYGENPLAAIKNVKKKIDEIASGLPEKAVIDFSQATSGEIELFAASQRFDAYNGSKLNQEGWIEWLKKTSVNKRPSWVKYSRITIVPFYDRTELIYETLGTLNNALTDEILVTVIVVLISMMHFASSILISAVLPLAVLICFVAMKQFGIDANVVALSGIAIAIGTMVDMGIVVCENILRHLDEWRKEKAAKSTLGDRSSLRVIYEASTEVGGAVTTSIAMTIVGFLPVFVMVGAEGKLFKPLAFTKSFALLASVLLALTMIPVLAQLFFVPRARSEKVKWILHGGIILAGAVIAFLFQWWAGAIVIALGLYHVLKDHLPRFLTKAGPNIIIWMAAATVIVFLTEHWMPLGPQKGMSRNLVFVAVLIGGLLGSFNAFRYVYPQLLRWCLHHKFTFICFPAVLIVAGGLAWFGFEGFLGWLPERVKNTQAATAVANRFPGLGKEFMPPLDEGSFLFMPTTMPHASIGEAMDVLQKQDMAIRSIPEIETVVGKLGRVDSPLDPAPISMFETIINYKPEYLVDRSGGRVRFKHDHKVIDLFRDESGNPVLAADGKPYQAQGKYERDASSRLIPDSGGVPFRYWRPPLDPQINPGRKAWAGIKNPGDIWDQIVTVTKIPGTTSAPKLQPIAARIVMLASGMRAPMGVKIKGSDLKTIEKVGLQIEKFLKEVPSIRAEAVVADRIVAKPYLEINIDREAIARYGVPIRSVQNVIEVAIGGKPLTTTVEGRERYPVRVRYLRELRDQIESLDRILVPAPDGAQIPLIQLAEIEYRSGPQVIKSEDTFLVGYVVFDMKEGYAEVNVVEEAQTYLKEKIKSGEFIKPAGITYDFAGSYLNQQRATKTLMVVVPVALFVIFIILYMQFQSFFTTLLVFSGIFVAWAGGFIMVWLYGQPWFLNFSVFGTDMRELFQIHPINLSVAIWVGFLALFGIAAENGVVMAAFLDQVFAGRKIRSIRDIHQATIEGATKRIRPALMTSATTILALIPVLTSTGRGADIMVPMAIPSFGGMFVALITVLMVPVIYCLIEEIRFRLHPPTHSAASE